MKTVLALAAVAVGLVLAAIAGLWIYVSATATPLHPSAQSVQSVTRANPSPTWANAVERARQIARAGLTAQNLPGLSVAVGVGGEIVWAEGFGWADLETHAPVAPEMRFRTGGVSMALTSIVVGLLLEKDRLRLDDEIQKYVPAFPKKPWPVTLRQLMGHQAGIRKDGGDEEPLSERCAQTIDALPRFAERPLLFEPGTQFRYTTYGWILVSAAVEAAADQPFFRVMRDEVFRPLGLDDTVPDSATKPPSNVATFYYPRFAGDTRYGPEEATARGLRLLRGRRRVPVHAIGPGPIRAGDQRRASCCSPPPSRCCRHRSGWLPARRPAMASAGISRRCHSRANPRGRSAMTANTSSAARRR